MMSTPASKLVHDEFAVLLIATVGGLLFWWGYGFIKGVQFFVALCLIPQPVFLYSYWKGAR